jgi:glycosyltransferase involved in cell wall biosynthesis
MRILWHSNGPNFPTGYGLQTELFSRLLKRDYQLTISAFCGIQGSPMELAGVTILPGLKEIWGNDVINAHAAYTGAECVISLVDPFVLDPNAFGSLPWIAWAPVDSMPDKPENVTVLRHAKRVWAMSQHGYKLLTEHAGLDNVDYVPHGIDTQVFYPKDRREARKKVGEFLRVNLEGKFLISYVAANKGRPSRKNFDGLLQAFSLFSEQHPEAILYLHTDSQGVWNGENIRLIIRALGIDPAKVIMPDNYLLMTGMIGTAFLNDLYNATDIYCHPSLGEGFGIPIVEAQAAGCPVIVTDASAMTELCFSGWLLIGDILPATEGAYFKKPFVQAIIDALNEAWQENHDGKIQARREKAALMAKDYDYQIVYKHFMQPALEKFQEKEKPLSDKKLAVVTLWRNHPELISDYEKAVWGADEVVIIDNNSDNEVSEALLAMLSRLPGKTTYHKNDHNMGFSAANNLGASLTNAEHLLFLNNDVIALKNNWLNDVRKALLKNPKALHGVNLLAREVVLNNGDVYTAPYLEGWCLAMTRAAFDVIGKWNETDYPGWYWEDNDLCFSATLKDYALTPHPWGIKHLSNTTSKSEAGIYEQSPANRAVFVSRVREALGAKQNA